MLMQASILLCHPLTKVKKACSEGNRESHYYFLFRMRFIMRFLVVALCALGAAAQGVSRAKVLPALGGLRKNKTCLQARGRGCGACNSSLKLDWGRDTQISC